MEENQKNQEAIEEEDFSVYGNKLTISFKTKAGSDCNFELLFNWSELFIVIILICLIGCGFHHMLWGKPKKTDESVNQKTEAIKMVEENPIIIEPKPKEN